MIPEKCIFLHAQQGSKSVLDCGKIALSMLGKSSIPSRWSDWSWIDDILLVPLIWAFDTINVCRAWRTFLVLKLLGIHLQTFILANKKGLCNSIYTTADINFWPFYFNNKHQVPNTDRSTDLLLSPQGYLLLLRSFVWISCRFNRHCEDGMLINDPWYLFGIGLFLICPLSLISNIPYVHTCTYTHTSNPQQGQEVAICFPEGPYSVYCCLHWRGQIQFILMTRSNKNKERKQEGDRRQELER